MIKQSCDDILAGEPAWIWLGYAMRNGDLYHACGLINAFRAQHGMKAKIRLILAPGQALGLAQLYADKFDEIRTYSPSCSLEDLIAEFERRGLNTFGFNKPILLHPHRNPRVAPNVDFSNRYGLTWMDLYKSILSLDPEAEFAPPAMNAERLGRAQAFCREHDITPGRSVILFPYAQSFPVGAIDHFAHFSAAAAAQGWRVFTSIAGTEEAVPGTTGVHIPFELLPDVVFTAGWGMAVRSGICDVLAHVRARKTFIFRGPRELSTWSVAMMGLGRDADELAFDFVKQSPADFTAMVFGDLSHGSTAWPPRARLTDALNLVETGSVETLDFAKLQRNPDAITALEEVVRTGRDVRRVMNLPPRSTPFWRDLLDQAIDIIARSAAGNIYVCRDNGHFDWFEAVSAEALCEGRYSAAESWHTIVIAPVSGLADTLPRHMEWLVAERDVWDGEPTSLAGVRGDDVDLRGQGLTPLNIRGLQLVGRWHGLEGWGLWSQGAVCTLRFVLAQTRPGGFVLRLGCFAALSELVPGVTVNAVVNGRPVGQLELRRDLPSRLDVPFSSELTGDQLEFFVRLEIDQVRSPLDVGEGGDSRQLGLGLFAAELAQLNPDQVQEPIGLTNESLPS